MILRKHLAFGVVYGLILTLVTLAGTEFLASFYAPSWPARALRAVSPVNPVKVVPESFSNQPWLAETYNSWGMRDSERTLAKPPDIDFRAVFVGDSFVESLFAPLSLPAAVERRLAGMSRTIEAVNLGISASGPRSYYYRLRDVALKLSPDAIVLFFYAGNDFMLPNESYSTLPPLVSESPGGSLLGAVMPRTNWLLVNRLRLAESLRGSEPLPGEETTLYDIVHGPPAERLRRLVAHARQTYEPELSEAIISEVLSRGDDRFWNDLEKQDGESEVLFGWTLSSLLSYEARTFRVVPTSRQDAARLRQDGVIEATLSWLAAANRLAQERRVPLKIFLVPVASLDPAYVEFWKPWPRAFSWNYVCEDREFELVAALRAAGIPFVNLREDLAGISGTYRKRDGHWTQKGEAIVADRVARELRSMMGL